MSINRDRDAFFESGGISLNVRSSSLDVLLTTLGLGTILILILLYMIYLLVRYTRGKRPSYSQSKADRPAWILLLVISGSAWIFSTLLYSGVVVIEIELGVGCSVIKFVGQYLFGYVLWTAAVIYKLVRKFYQLRLVGQKPPHAVITILVQLIPFVILAGLEANLARCVRDELDLCSIDYEWLVVLYLMVGILLIAFQFCFIKIRKTIGVHHEIIRYSIFLATSFSFPVIDGIVQFTSLRYEVLAGQVLAILVLLLVIGNLTHIFVLVLKGRHHGVRTTMGVLPPNELTLRPTEMASISSITSDTPEEPTSAALDDINAIMTDGALEQSIKMSLHPAILLTKPRRRVSEEVLPNFERFVDNLPSELCDQIDRGRGYFVARSRPKIRTIVEFDMDSAFRYLDST